MRLNIYFILIDSGLSRFSLQYQILQLSSIIPIVQLSTIIPPNRNLCVCVFITNIDKQNKKYLISRKNKLLVEISQNPEFPAFQLPLNYFPKLNTNHSCCSFCFIYLWLGFQKHVITSSYFLHLTSKQKMILNEYQKCRMDTQIFIIIKI